MKLILNTNKFGGTGIIRLMVGAVFLSEGIQKFLFPDLVGIGRFIKIGILFPEFFAPFVGVVEIISGLLILIGLFTRAAALTLIVNMVVAIIATKVPILKENGFWKMAHDSRTDFVMLLGGIYLLLYGGGKWSIDLIISTKSDDSKK